MLFMDYTFTLAGDNIMMDRELSPELVNIQEGDRFIATISEIEWDGKKLNQIVFVKHPEDRSTPPPEQE